MTNHRWLSIVFLSVPLVGALGVTAGGWSYADAQGPPRDVRPQQPEQTPRDPSGAPQKPIVGKGVISGVVVVAGSGQPARRARVSLSAPQGTGSRSTATDDTGAFSFTALPEGRYSLSASKPGHINGSFGQRIPGRSGTPIQLADGQKLQVQLQVWRGAVITGTLVDEHGEAIPNTPVRVLRYAMPGGQRTLQQAGTAQTDDRGIYRIFGLQPGEYLVSATPRNMNQTTFAAGSARAAVAAALERVGSAGGGDLAQIQSAAERAGQVRFEMVQGGAIAGADEQPTGYAPVYYPGTTSPASAAAVTVGPGEEKSGVDFQYQVVPVARVDGIVTTSSGQLPPNVTLSLVNTGFNVPGISPGGARADAQGNFTINNVPPGQYRIVARAAIAQGREGRPGGRGLPPGGRGEMAMGAARGRAGGPPPADPVRLWGTADVTVDGRTVSGVVVALQPGVQVGGRIAFEGTSLQPPTDLSRMRVSLQPVVTPGSSGDVASGATGRVEADGRFTLSSVVPGRYRLLASGAGAGWSVGSSSLEGQDSLDFPVEIKSAIAGAVVTFTDKQSELTGMITNDQSQPVFDYTLVVYPADMRYRQPQSRRILTTRPATDGRYIFRNLPPGEYRIAPVLDPEPGSWFDPAFLQQLDGSALRLSIGEGEKKEQNLRVPGSA